MNLHSHRKEMKVIINVSCEILWQQFDNLEETDDLLTT